MGCVPVSFFIKARRIMFWYYLISIEENEMLSKVFIAQENSPVKGDWCLQVKDDLNYFGIDPDKKVVLSMKKESFKNLVKKSCTKVAYEHLIIEKNKLSKLKNMQYTELTMQKYLKSNQISTRMKKLLFKLRTRMIDVGNK